MSSRNTINLQDKNFRREVGIAKNKYRKKRFSIFLLISFIILLVSSIRIYFFINEKNELEREIETQKQEIAQLEKENKSNEILISKFKDPYFITDLARQEYSMSYPGEIIFNIPLRENFIENSTKNITDNNENNKTYKVDENKLDEILKKQKETKDKEKEKDKEKDNEKKEDKNT